MTKIDDVKAHVRKHKTVYIVGSVVIVGGFVVLKTTPSINNHPIALAIGKGNIVAQTNVNVTMTRPGPKAFVVQCLEDQKIWPSIRQAAKDLGVNPSRISEQLSGQIDSVNGKTFTKLAEV